MEDNNNLTMEEGIDLEETNSPLPDMAKDTQQMISGKRTSIMTSTSNTKTICNGRKLYIIVPNFFSKYQKNFPA